MKDAFDPDGLLNPGRIVRAPRFDDRSLFRYGPDYRPIEGFSPQLDWSDYPGPLGGLMGAVEMCNNNGQCRKFDAGAMCPSYRATRDEQHLVRGRANTLRLALTGQLGQEALASDDVAEALKLCVSCKACRRECPTGVDMAKMKIEATAARAAQHGISFTRTDRCRTAALRAACRNLRRRRQSSEQSPLRCAACSIKNWDLPKQRDLPAWRTDTFRDEEASRLRQAGERDARTLCCSPTRSTATSSPTICALRSASSRRLDGGRCCRATTAVRSVAAGPILPRA